MTLRRALIRPKSLTAAGFEKYGDVISASEVEARGLSVVDANQGTAKKWVDVTNIHDFYNEASSGVSAKVVVNMFICRPRDLERRDGREVFPVKVLERHPFTAQMFVPLGVSSRDTTVRYLVIVAPTLQTSGDPSPTAASTSSSTSTAPARKGSGPPDLDNIEAFWAMGDQAVTYGAGTWHAPMVVLGERPIEFVVVQYSNGVDLEDCQEHHLEARADIGVDVGDEKASKSKL